METEILQKRQPALQVIFSQLFTDRMSLANRLKKTGKNEFTMCHASPHAKEKGRLKRPTSQVGREGFHQVWGNVEDCQLVDDAVKPYNVEGLCCI